MKHHKTILDFKCLEKRLIFTSPIKEIIAETLDEVLPALKLVSDYQKQGYYVVGYISYEASPAFDDYLKTKQSPLMTEKLLYFTVHDTCVEEKFPVISEFQQLTTHWEATVDLQAYHEAINQIKQEIRQGNTYQVNYTIPLTGQLKEDSEAIYQHMLVEQEAGYNAYIQTDDFTLISFSPELFFEQDDHLLTTRPMKGTIERGCTNQEDLAKRDWLFSDSKNRAENMMIVDLLRNDMSSISKIGSVQVTNLCQVEQYSTVWQMTSTVTSELLDEVGLVDIFKALYPCGSITGAPKISTMEIINRVEKTPRGVYCGSIGICLPDKRSIFNVAIRTIQLNYENAVYGVGGGITWYSDWMDEYNEIKKKSQILYRSSPLFSVITTGKISKGQLIFKEEHLKRLNESCRYFNFPYSSEKIESLLDHECQTLNCSVDYRLKIRIDKSGDVKIESSPLEHLPTEFLEVELKERSIEQYNPFLYFKTSYRPHIPKSSCELIFHSKEGNLQETSIGNLILEKDGKYYTPPVSEGIIDGIYRRYLLAKNRLIEKRLTLKDLKTADKLLSCNSVRGIYELKWRSNDRRRSN